MNKRYDHLLRNIDTNVPRDQEINTLPIALYGYHSYQTQEKGQVQKYKNRKGYSIDLLAPV